MQRKRHFHLKSAGLLTLVPVFALTMALTLAGKTNEKETKIPEATPNKAESFQPAAAILSETMLVAEITKAPIPVPAPKIVERYAEITMTEEELRDLAEIIYHEARGESFEGQQAVAEVVFNRVIADNFPDTVHEVIHQKKQFSTARLLGTAEPLQEQYDAINAALYGPTILPADVVFFSRDGENDKVWGSIGGHVFCYQYDWD